MHNRTEAQASVAQGTKPSSSTDLETALNPHHPTDTISVGWLDAAGERHRANVRLVEGPPA